MGNRAGQIAGLAVAFLIGCNESPPSNPSPPIAKQILQTTPDLKTQRFSNLLSFETPADIVFVSASGLSIETEQKRAHTGHASLRVSGQSGKLTINLAAVLPAQQFPNGWTLVGAYFFTNKPGEVNVSCDADGKKIAQNKVTLVPGQWTAVMADLSGIAQQQPTMPSLNFDIDCEDVAWCDDVMLIDNAQFFQGGWQSDWSVRRSGYSVICMTRELFAVRLTAADANANGWRLEEVNDWRARLSSDGKNKSLTVYRDGRSYWDGEYRPLAESLRAEPLWEQDQNSPAEIEVPESMGRVDRRTPGDANNDGYNEAKATYQIVARGPRLEVQIIPHTVPALEPMLEIRGLPSGNVLVTVEGRLVETTLRLSDGTLLVQIPAKIGRPTTVDLRVQ